MASTTLANVVVPDVFSRYTRFLSIDISALVQSGAVVVDSRLNADLGGGGTIFQYPFWDALSQSASNVGSDDPSTSATLRNIAAANSKAPRMSRNNAWGSMHLAMTDSGEDSLAAIQSSLAQYWAIELQKIVIAAISGMNKDNGTNDSGDFAHDVAGTSFTDGTTNFTIANLVDAGQTLGDHKFALSILVVHSVVAAQMEKLEYVTVGVRPSAGAQLARWGRYTVLITDMIPSGTSVVRANAAAGVATMYESWLFGPGVIRIGVAAPPNTPAEEVVNLPLTGNGAGQTGLVQRVEYTIAVPGMDYNGTIPEGGPSNASTSHNLNNAGSWNRTVNSRKQIPFARLVTRES